MKSRVILLCTIFSLIFAVSSFAGGRGEIPPPQITLDLPENSYFSPGVADDIQDTVSWNVTIAASERFVVKGYRIIVTDESGSETYRFEETYPGQQPFFQRMFIGVGFARFKEPVTIPETLTWDGTTTEGEPAPEGRYSLVVEGWDDGDRTGSSDTYAVTIDNTAPTAQVTLPYSVFSPNADGNKDILIVEQSGSSEPEWRGVVYDEDDSAVFEATWEQSAPGNITWDGTDPSGETSPDGAYRYELIGSDLAGNSVTVSLENVSINTQDTPIAITRNVGSFSPNDDESTDTISFSFEVPVTDGIRDWTFTILDSSDAARRTIEGDTVPSGVEFDGVNDAGDTLPEGVYRGRLSVQYINGNNPTATSSEFTLDVTAPVASVKAFPLIFSPNGDGSQDTIQVFQETSAEEVWTGTVVDAEGGVVREIEWRGRAEQTVAWDGRDATGELASDGEYRYILSTRDRAGNYTEAQSDPFLIDTRETPVALTSDGTYFSPNADGVRDALALIPEIEDPEGFLRLEVTITDEAGNNVRTFESTDPVANIAWDGRNNSNRPAINGRYMAVLNVEYSNGNKPSARIGPIVIDRTVPSATVSTSETFFSPDGDGNLDSIQVEQTSASNEDAWIGRFFNESDEIVRTIQWTGTPESFVWDGSDEEGNRLSDGNYRYELTATDRAGNRGSFGVDRLTIDTRPTPVALRIGTSAFSPNGDEVKDNVLITPVLEVTENIDSWKLSIVDSSGAEARVFEGEASAPEPIEFDGRSSRGSVLPEGSYAATLSVLYLNGNRPSESSPVFTIDVTAPKADVSAATRLFSPNGDGRKDLVAFSQSGSPEETWTGTIIDSSDNAIREYTWLDRLEPSVEWDGRDSDGKIVQNGTYRYVVSTTDRAGNEGGSRSVSVEVDNRPTSVTLASDVGHFSPNGDGTQDTIRINPTLSLSTGVASYTLEIVGAGNEVVRTFDGRTRVPNRIEWDGKLANGRALRDGSYFARITVEYEKGDRPTAQSSPFSIDTVAPTATIGATETVFSPEGDGQKDEIVIGQDTSSEELWEASVIDSDGNSVRNEFWKGRAEDFTWDGRDDDGSVVADGTYRYVLTSSDRAGNSISRVIPSIRVDTRITSAFISTSTTAITPNGDGRDDAVTINLYTGLDEGVASWSLTIVDESGRSVRNLTTGSQRSVPASLSWNGRNDGGRVVDGSYTPHLAVEYEKGNVVEASATRPVLVDVSGPVFNITTAPTPFSPDDDGENDVVRISLSGVRDASSVASWKVDIIDPYGNLFFQRSGRGVPPASFQWDGYSVDDELVQAAEDYQVRGTLVDSLGNVGEKSVVLPIDILVLKDGNNLKIRISSIQFAPNSADFLTFDEEKAERNLKTLTRLAEILRKYSSYQIRIEGHAVSVYWNNPARARREETEELKPLSKARADAVKDALVDLGIPASRMTTEGMGGTQPIVPHSDLENRWKSRRVEFILIR